MTPAVTPSKIAGPGLRWLPALLFTGLAVFYLYLGVHEGVPGIIADDAIYLLMADAWTPYYPEPARSAEFISEHVRFPPLYPWLLSLTGAGGSHLAAAHAVTIGFLLGSFVACYVWLRGKPETSSHAAFLVFGFGMLPTTQIHALNLWSEHLYLLLTVCALAAHDGRTLARWLIVALLVSAAALTRTIGIAVVAAFVASVWLTPAPRRVWLTVAATAPVALWALINSLDATDDQNVAFLLSKYGSSGIRAAWSLVVVNLEALWHGWRTSFDIVGTKSGLALAVVFAGLWLAGWFVRIRRLHFDAIYVVLYLGIVLIWPNHDHARRFLFPLIPVALFQCLAFINRLPPVGLRTTSRLYGTMFFVSLIVAAAPSFAAISARLFAPIPQEISEFRRTEIWLTHVNARTAAHNLRMLKLAISSYEIAARYIPPGACVFSVHPEMFMYYVRRSSYAPPLPLLPDDEFRIRIQRCRFVHLLWITTHPYLPAGYPGWRLNHGTVLYRARRKSNDGITPYAELIDLKQNPKLPGDVALPPGGEPARLPQSPGPVANGGSTCIADCP